MGRFYFYLFIYSWKKYLFYFILFYTRMWKRRDSIILSLVLLTYSCIKVFLFCISWYFYLFLRNLWVLSIVRECRKFDVELKSKSNNFDSYAYIIWSWSRYRHACACNLPPSCDFRDILTLLYLSFVSYKVVFNFICIFKNLSWAFFRKLFIIKKGNYNYKDISICK